MLRSALVLALLACEDPAGLAVDASTPVDAAPRVVTDDPGFLEADPPGAWYAGDLHVHASGASNDTGGDSTPEAIAAVARDRGLSFVVLTDHSNSTGSDVTTTDEDPSLFNMGPEFPHWDEALRLTEPGVFLMVDGNEVSPVAAGEAPIEARGHIGCVPADLATFDRGGAFVDRPRGEVTGGECLRQARERGCFTVVNHPYGLAPWIVYDWTDMGYEALEVWNGGAGLDAADWRAWDAWRCDLLAGKTTVPVGGSDNHRVHQAPPGEPLHPPLGWPRTSVYAERLEWPAIVAGLRAGRVALHEGGSFLGMDAYDSSGARTEAPAVGGWLRLRGTVSAEVEGAGTLRLRRATSCDDPRPATRPPLVEDEVVWEREVPAGASFDVAVPVDAPGVFAATLVVGVGLHHGALSRGFRVAP